MTNEPLSVDMKVLFDNPDKDDREMGWGISFLFNDQVLLDTAENGELLMTGLDHFGVDISGIRDVVISHDHWDHTGGLVTLLRAHPWSADVRVWLPPSSSSQLKSTAEATGAEVIYPKGPTEIQPGFRVTGELPGEWCNRPMTEQALIVEGDSTFAMFTACAHPGVERMLDYAIAIAGGRTPVFMGGGFHLDDRDDVEVRELIGQLQERGVKHVAPTHCTGLDAIALFQELYGDDCLSLGRFAVREILLD